MARKETTVPTPTENPAQGSALEVARQVEAGFTAPPAQVANPADEFGLPAGYVPEIARQVTVPVLKWEAGTRIVAQITKPIELGKELSEGRAGKTKMEPAHITIIKGYTGALRTLIVGAVLRSELEEAYPQNSYVGKWFAMQKFEPAGDKRYATYHILEIADPTK